MTIFENGAEFYIRDINGLRVSAFEGRHAKTPPERGQEIGWQFIIVIGCDHVCRRIGKP